MRKIFLTTIIILITFNSTFAVPAKRVVVNVLQKNGTEISIRLQGDEHYKFKTTEDGILITENSDGIFEYARMDKNGKISTTGILAKNKISRSKEEISLINTLNNNDVFEISMKIRKERAEEKNLLRKSNAPSSTNSVGEKGIAILVNFSDKAFVTPNANTSFRNLLNQTGYSVNNALGSARDYFIACSDSLFQPIFDVYGPYTLPKTLNYYGENETYYPYDDKHAEEMITSACSLAYNAGVDFSQYDTNNDGYVDNVFVFYAGYNEASGAPANTIWPHRHTVVPNKYNAPKFGSVRVYDYACSSELKDYTGSEMDGIGTFCHEFSHVLDLPDLYSSDVNLEDWDLMDYGCYNHNGDVPAMYSAYEMFYVGWLVPEILTQYGNYVLEPLYGAQKKAYLVAKSNSHNLNGKNPNPTEFFMLENRQQISYDTYLPGSGLLITRINFNASKWTYNIVNDSQPKGVEIMKANNKNSSYYTDGWAFPYSSTNSFAFKSATGTNPNWGKNVSQIQRIGQNISFNYGTTTDIKETKENDFDVIYFPLSWYVSMDYSNYSMEIYTINGILLKTFNFTNEINIVKSDFPNGVYLLKIRDLNNNKLYFSKIVK